MLELTTNKQICYKLRNAVFMTD